MFQILFTISLGLNLKRVAVVVTSAVTLEPTLGPEEIPMDVISPSSDNPKDIPLSLTPKLTFVAIKPQKIT